MDELDQRLETAILDLLHRRARTSTICPSDAARAVADEDGWRDLMEPARAAARRLVDSGAVQVTQRGRVVDPGDGIGADPDPADPLTTRTPVRTGVLSAA